MSKVVLLLAALAVMESCLAAALTLSHGFYDLLSVFCVIGASVGSFMTIAILPPVGDSEDNKIRRLSLKFSMSIIASVVFAPPIMMATGAPRKADYLMAISALVAVATTSAIHVFFSALRRFR